MKKTLIGLVAGLVLAGGSVALATIPDSGGVIHGCYKTSDGKLRVIDSAESCGSGETAISWSQTGPQGPQGEQGEQGEQGPAGPAGTTLVRLRATATVIGSTASFSVGSSTQPADAIDRFIGQVTVVSTQQGCAVAGGLILDGNNSGSFSDNGFSGPSSINFDGQANRVREVFEPGVATSHTLTPEASSGGCGGPEEVIIEVDVEQVS